MTIQEMNERRKELGYSYERLSELSGVPVGTLQKVLGGITKSPRYETLRALERVLRPIDDFNYDWRKDSSIREAAVAYEAKVPGEYTIEDYYALPDKKRVELIDGEFYDMASPVIEHQTMVAEIFVALREFIRKRKGKCIPGMAPLDVQFENDDKTVVQPDVLVICDKNKIVNGRIYGAPDFIVEVVSPSTSIRDKGLKMGKYLNAGVREYWIVDIRKKSVIVYADDGADDHDIFLYTFDNEVPVRIFDGECKINFKEIYEYMAFMYEK